MYGAGQQEQADQELRARVYDSIEQMLGTALYVSYLFGQLGADQSERAQELYRQIRFYNSRFLGKRLDMSEFKHKLENLYKSVHSTADVSHEYGKLNSRWCLQVVDYEGKRAQLAFVRGTNGEFRQIKGEVDQMLKNFDSAHLFFKSLAK